MFNGYHCRHSVSHVGSGEVHILFLQYIELSGIIINRIGEHGLKAGQMSAAFRIVYIIAKTKYIFVKLIHILKGHLDGYALTFSAEINDVVNTLLRLVHIADEAHNAFRLVIFDIFGFRLSFILIYNRKGRIQIRRLMKAAFHFILLKTRLIENRVIRKEVHPCSRRLGFTDNREQPVLQLDDRIASFIFILINKSAVFYLNRQIC